MKNIPTFCLQILFLSSRNTRNLSFDSILILFRAVFSIFKLYLTVWFSGKQGDPLCTTAKTKHIIVYYSSTHPFIDTYIISSPMGRKCPELQSIAFEKNKGLSLVQVVLYIIGDVHCFKHSVDFLELCSIFLKCVETSSFFICWKISRTLDIKINPLEQLNLFGRET